MSNGNLTIGNTLNVLGQILQNGVPFVSGSNTGNGSGTGTGIGSNGILATSNSTFSLLVNSNVLTLSSASNGYVGIAGNSNPKWSLDVAGSVNFTGGLYQNGSLFSTPASFPTLSAFSNATASNLSWTSASGGSLNLNTSLVSPTTITSQIVIGGSSTGLITSSGSGTTNSLWVTSNLSVGATASNPNYPFVVTDSGNAGVSAYFNGSILVQQVLEVSDIRVKKDIVPVTLDEARRALKMIGVKKFDYIEENHKQKRRAGFIAQELEKILPECVNQVVEYIPNIHTIGKVVAQNTIRLLAIHVPVTIDKGDIIKLYRGKTPIYATCTGIEEREKEKEKEKEKDIHVDVDLNFTSPKKEDHYENIFVYGTRVDDFKVISTEPILALLVKCVQSLL